MTNSLRVKNHYVPECYLKRWANKKRKVYAYQTLVAHSNVPIWKGYSVGAIAYQKHLYTQVICGAESDELERWLSTEFESPANKSLEKAVSGSKLDSEDWRNLINFLAAQDVRTPLRLLEFIQRQQAELPRILQEVLDNLEHKLKNQNNIDALKSKKTSSPKFPLKVTAHIRDREEMGILEAETIIGRSTWIFSIKHLLQNTSRALHKHEWSIVRPAAGHFWPTSDNPVVKLNYYEPGRFDLKGGWDVKKGNIFFPISPKHAMFVQMGDAPPKNYSRLSKFETEELTKTIIENSHRKVFSNKIRDDIPKIKKRIVDPARLKEEKEELERWHNINSKLEQEYLS